jgi:hypothetical protein
MDAWPSLAWPSLATTQRHQAHHEIVDTAATTKHESLSSPVGESDAVARRSLFAIAEDLMKKTLAAQASHLKAKAEVKCQEAAKWYAEEDLADAQRAVELAKEDHAQLAAQSAVTDAIDALAKTQRRMEEAARALAEAKDTETRQREIELSVATIAYYQAKVDLTTALPAETGADAGLPAALAKAQIEDMALREAMHDLAVAQLKEKDARRALEEAKAAQLAVLRQAEDAEQATLRELSTAQKALREEKDESIAVLRDVKTAGDAHIELLLALREANATIVALREENQKLRAQNNW